jgi:hypothetical protein
MAVERDFEKFFDDITNCEQKVYITRVSKLSDFNYTAYKSNPANFIDISGFTTRIEIENSVDMSFRVGKIVLKDSFDMTEILPLTGNEIVYIEYSNRQAELVKDIVNDHGFFRVVDIRVTKDVENLNKMGDAATRQITLYLAEFPYVDLLTFNKINSTFFWGGGEKLSGLQPSGVLPISELIALMLTTKIIPNVASLGLILDIEKTADIDPTALLNYYSPNWTLLKNINYLKRLCTSFVGGHPLYYLNCEKNTISFKSILSTWKTEPFATVNSIELIPPEVYGGIPTFNIAPSDLANTLIDVELSISNGLNPMFAGLSGETMFTFDFMNGHKFQSFDYRLFKTTEIPKDIGGTFGYFEKYGTQLSKFSTSVFTNTAQNSAIKRADYARRAFDSLTCKALTYVSAGRYLGQTVHVGQPSSTDLANSKVISDYLGKSWCLWGYKNIIQDKRAMSILTLKKDSAILPLASLAGTALPANTYIP